MPFRLFLAALAVALLPACSSGIEPGDEITVTGTVTNDASSSKSAAPIEGAVVSASAVSAGGSLAALPGSATTDASGSFSLSTEASADPVVLSATSTGFTSRALLEAGAAVRSRATAPPMTAETDAEAGVFLAARARETATSVADAVYFVSAEVAADLRSGAVAQADVAAALSAAIAAERAAAEGEDIDDEEPRDAREDDYASLRAALAAAGSQSARAAAVARFETDYADAYGRAGLSARARARVASSRSKAVVAFSSTFSSRAKLAVRRRARVAAARSTALAVEAAFQAEGAAASRMSALAAARAELIAEVEAASSNQEMNEAEAEYANTVRAEISAETGVSSVQLSAAAQASAAARATLNTAVSAASSGSAVASAVMTFYGSVESGARSTFGADSVLAIEAFTLVAVY